MKRKSKENARRTATFARSRSRGVTVGSFLLIAVVILGFVLFTRSSHSAATQNQPPSKPNGTQISNPPTTESWTVAKGLPSNVTQLAFSAGDPTRGYAAVFVNKQTQDIYETADSGNSWLQTGTVQGPVGDILSTDPLDPQDIVILSVYAPTPGTYTFQRSLDGGRAWSSQSTDLLTTGMVSQTGWSDSTFLVGFQLDGQLQGSSALVAFPKGQPSVHLDANGKINGTAIAHLSLLTGSHGKVIVWGDDDSAAQNIIGIATIDFGKNWASLRSDILGKKSIPVAATNDGTTIVAISEDRKQMAVSGDGGVTWAAQPSFIGTLQSNQSVFVTAHGKTLVVTESDGTYTLHNGVWSKITSKKAVYASESDAQHAARLWSYDAQGRVIWHDD